MISKKTVDSLSRLKDVRSWNYREINAQFSLDYGEFRFYQLGLLKENLNMELIDELRKRFGFSSFRPGQEEIIQALLQEQMC